MADTINAGDPGAWGARFMRLTTKEPTKKVPVALTTLALVITDPAGVETTRALLDAKRPEPALEHADKALELVRDSALGPHLAPWAASTSRRPFAAAGEAAKKAEAAAGEAGDRRGGMRHRLLEARRLRDQPIEGRAAFGDRLAQFLDLEPVVVENVEVRVDPEVLDPAGLLAVEDRRRPMRQRLEYVVLPHADQRRQWRDHHHEDAYKFRCMNREGF